MFSTASTSRTRSRCASVVTAFAFALTLAAMPPANAQVFTESFDSVGVDAGNGPAALLAKGFVFRKALVPALTHQPWKQGPWHAGQPAAKEGSGFLSGGISVPGFGPYDYAEWILLPPIPGLTTGQVVSFWVRGFVASFPSLNHVELRYSPTGGTATGTTPTSVGDFTIALAGNSNSVYSTWDHVQVAVPGSGRLAIRWHGSIFGDFFGTSLDCLIDDLTVTTNGITPPLPGPGQTVHWTTAMSPIHLTNQQVVPAGGTLVIDAGVQVYFDFTAEMFAGSEIRSDGGSILLAGTSANPVVLRRGVNTSETPRIGVGNGGTLEADWVDSDVKLLGNVNSRFVARNCSIHRATPIDWASLTDALYQVPSIAIGKSTGSVIDCTFTNALCSIDDAIARIEGNTLIDSSLIWNRFPIAQPAMIDGNVFTNSHVRAPLVLDGYDFHVGPNNVFTNNPYPIDLFGAGLTPDSVVPASGNDANKVRLYGSDDSEIKGPMTLPNLGVPYLVPSTITAGDQFDSLIRILPGATLEMGPQVGLLFEGVARIDVRGTPQAPVTFKRANPLQPWISFSIASDPPLIVRNGRFEGAQWAAGVVDALFFAQDCEFIGNGEGIRTGDLGAAIVSRCRFLDNAVGINVPWSGLSGIDLGRFVDYGSANPNSFEGTGQAIVIDPTQLVTYDMEHAWWGNSTGPAHASNPGGSGQQIVGAVDFTPFRTTPVTFSDHPPIVDVVQVAKNRLLKPGTKIVLHWNAKDDRKIVSQRLEYRANGGFAAGVVAIPSISPLARNVEFTIPDTFSNPPPGWGGDTGKAVFRLVAVDDVGQEGFDDFYWTLALDHSLPVAFTTDLSGIHYVGESFDVFTTLGGATAFSLFIDDLPHDFQPKGASLSVLSNTMPAVSTNRARYVVDWLGEPHYSEYFTIRPNDSLGDLPPTITIVSPLAGQDFAGGSVIPIAWSASDDRGLRSFDLQASYDGVTWHPFAEGLPGMSTQYAWQFPASSGIQDVQVRVIARDLRFQATAAETAPFDVLPGGSAWFDLGHALAGTAGVPKLSGSGTPAVGQTVSLALTQAKPNTATTFLFIGLSKLGVPLLGGTLVPAPDVVIAPIATNGAGAWTIPATWPAGVPSGTQIIFQCWIEDPAGPVGAAASNGLGVVAP
jgi:hypothetical protein